MSDTTNGPVPTNPLTFGPVTVSAGDPRYESLVVENYNHRFVGKPDYIRLVGTTEQVVEAVGEAVANGRRIAVRSGRHCFEDFTSSPDVEVLLDLSHLSNVYFDAERGAFAIEAGATLGHVYRTLFSGWGVTIPGGTCFDVGAGGHITGGGYGHLSRRHGLVVDHLDAVEVVVVDATGRARAVVATRDPDDPNHDLWWASAGGGGGNFGVVTRFWMRTPGAGSTDPADLLPKAPTAMRRNIVMWPWEPMTEASWTRLVRNYCTWFENNSAPNSPYANLWTDFIITHRVSGKFGLTSVIDEVTPDAEQLLNAQIEAISRGVGVEPVMNEQEVLPWWSKWMPSYTWPADPDSRYKYKFGYLRKGPTDRQLSVIYRYLSGDGSGHANPTACFELTAVGGRISTVAPDATAIPHRDSILKASYNTGIWVSAAEDEKHISWVREYYREVYAETGGVPVPNEINDGSYISFPDVDLADPAWNTSGVGWQTLYYKDNYPRLQRVKKAYDPRNVFRHALSVELPDDSG